MLLVITGVLESPPLVILRPMGETVLRSLCPPVAQCEAASRSPSPVNGAPRIFNRFGWKNAYEAQHAPEPGLVNRGVCAPCSGQAPTLVSRLSGSSHVVSHGRPCFRNTNNKKSSDWEPADTYWYAAATVGGERGNNKDYTEQDILEGRFCWMNAFTVFGETTACDISAVDAACRRPVW